MEAAVGLEFDRRASPPHKDCGRADGHSNAHAVRWGQNHVLLQ